MSKIPFPGIAKIGVPYFDLGLQTARLRPEIDDAIARVLDSGIFVSGPEVEAFEKEFAFFCGVKHAVAVNSGTAALHLALLADGVGPGDEVITTASSFIATSEAIRHCGARPVFVDIDSETLQIDVNRAEAARTERTKKILPVHLYGQMAPMDKLIESWGVSNIIEDACQAVGSTYRGQHAGKRSRSAAYSFYPGKNLGALGEGGMLVTGLSSVAEEARSRRSHGTLPGSRYSHDKLGFNYRLDEIQAAILRIKLRELPQWNARRREIAAYYRQELPSEPRFELQHEVPHGRGNYHIFAVQVATPDRFRTFLQGRNIGTGRHYPCALHEQVCNDDLYPGLVNRRLPYAEGLAKTCVSLPIWPEMTDDQVGHVTKAVQEYLLGFAS